MTKPNGSTARWMGILIAVAFGVWGIAMMFTSKTEERVTKITSKTDERVSRCEDRILELETNTARVDERLKHGAREIEEIKAMLRAKGD